MESLYSAEHLALQEEFGTTKLATMLDTNWAHETIRDDERDFIQSRDMLFLSTVDPEGNPTVSYKGGAPGFVRVVDAGTLVFPGYDGNGMFLSMGNIEGQGRVGLLFIDFETPHRVRVQGRARMLREDRLMDLYPEAKYLVRVDVTKVWVNCPRYIHPYRRLGQSKYVPLPDRPAPLAKWKRIDIMQEVLSDEDRARAGAEGVIDMPAYQEQAARGDG